LNSQAGSAIWTPGTTVLGVVTQLLGSNAAEAALTGMAPAAANPIDSAAALTSVVTTRRV
jgi:hypothetical protein